MMQTTQTMPRSVAVIAMMLVMGVLPLLADGHFISDPVRRQAVEEAFESKMRLVGMQFFTPGTPAPTQEEMEALHFLYAYMPLADITDYPTSFHLSNVRRAFAARREMPWGERVPELLFRHFVLPVRVNNEALDTFRMACYNDLTQRVKGLDMREAILEVNHWCHERVTYQPSDGRTSSPLNTIRSAWGRCGEESTLTAAALRTIGIPARQVYTPRWAHTDDNHAWVEAWADGEWHFMGACEPEPVLDLGWFNAPASRALLMHTRAFGDYDGPEEVMLRTNNFTEINLIDNYALSTRVDIEVVTPDGHPAAGARVDFKIYNYAEFCTVATKYADADGKTFLSAGLGDMVTWASNNGHYGFKKISFGKDKTVVIHLDRCRADDLRQTVHNAENYDIVPPPQHPRMPAVSDAQRATNTARLAIEDSIRRAYMATAFLNDEQARALAKAEGLDADSVAIFLTKARSNHPCIMRFLSSHRDNPSRAHALLRTLSDKDLRDMPLHILEDHYGATSDQLSPRVENEMVTLPFKQFLQDTFDPDRKERFRHDPSMLVAWVRDSIRLNPDTKALRIAQTPMGTWLSRITDTRSRDIFFVDLARSLGIEARKDYVTSKVQYRTGGKWTDVDFDAHTQAAAPTGTLVVRYSPTPLVDDPKYYTHFTITRIDNGMTRLLNFEEGQVDMGQGVSWSSTFHQGVTLDEGTYQMVTGMRLANGTALATSRIFNIHSGDTTTVDMVLRQSDTEVCVIGTFDSESRYTTPEGKTQSILARTGRGYFVVGLVGINHEPTNHTLRDIAKEKETFEKWGRPILLLFEDENALRQFDATEYGTLPSTVALGVDHGGKIRQQITRDLKMDDHQLPIFIIGDTFNRVVFQSQGYAIGLGDLMKHVIEKL